MMQRLESKGLNILILNVYYWNVLQVPLKNKTSVVCLNMKFTFSSQ